MVPSRAGSQTRIDAVAVWTLSALESLGRIPGVHRVGLALAEGGGRRLRFTASDRANRDGPAWCHIDAYDDVPLNTAIREGRTVAGTLDDLEERFAAHVSKQRATPTVGLASVPMITAGQAVGGFVLFFDDRQAFDAEQRLELQRLGADLGSTLRKAQRRQESAIATAPDQAVPAGAVALVHDVPGDVSGVADARRFLRGALDGWGVDEEARDTAVLCLSELVTNAVIHADSGCAVRVLLEDDVLTVTVRDHGSPHAVSPETADDVLRVHGRGLQVVDALATRWGSELDELGTTAWFVLEVQPAS